MFANLKATVSTPEFKERAIKVGAGVTSFVLTIVVSHLISKAVDAGMNALISQINTTDVSPLELE